MIHAGQTIENPVTGERVTFLTTAAETNGEVTVAEVVVQPNGFVAAAHIHPKQTEHFEILEGELRFKVDGKVVEAKAGDVLIVEPGQVHKFENVGDVPARFIVEVRPSLQWEQLLETMYGLAADGKTNEKGMPNPLRLAVIARAHFDDVQLPFPPVWMQRMGLGMGAPIGRMMGYQPTYVPAGAAATASA
jgi:mannose-6-phosphate isomerase-like protein (cupin superfamily)